MAYQAECSHGEQKHLCARARVCVCVRVLVRICMCVVPCRHSRDTMSGILQAFI